MTDWWEQQAAIYKDRLDRMERELTNALSSARSLVAMRMVRDAGKLKARTEQFPQFNCPPANRRLALPMAASGEAPDDRAAYIERATHVAQIVLDLGEAA